MKLYEYGWEIPCFFACERRKRGRPYSFPHGRRDGNTGAKIHRNKHFASLAPSFHLVDLCVGAAGAVLIRLAVYSKGKNAKKYRRGIEYGREKRDTPPPPLMADTTM